MGFAMITPTNPKTIPMLAMLDPMTFPRARSVTEQTDSAADVHGSSSGSRKAAIKLDIHSGRDVPKATSVRPMSISEMPIRLAISEAESMNTSEPFTRMISPPISMMTFRNKDGSKWVTLSYSSHLDL